MISSLRFKNFKCFEEQELRFGGLTLLAGLNGMGKSSVLQALLLLRQSHMDGLLPGKGLELDGSLVKLGTARDVLFEGAQADQLGIGISWGEGISQEFVFEYNGQSNVLNSMFVEEANTDFVHAPFDSAFQYIQAERLGPRIVHEVSDYLVREHRQIGTAGQYAAHFLSVYGDERIVEEAVRHPEASSNTLLHQTEAWLREISPGTELHQTLHAELDLVNTSYSFVTGEQRSNKYRATAVGFGISYVLPVIVAILSSKSGALVLLENPEAHLHPRGQSKMGELMARAVRAGVQVVAETHSDHVLNSIRVNVREGLLGPDAIVIHFFSRVEVGGRVVCQVDSPKIDSDGRLDLWPAGFFDEWDRALVALIKPKEER